ncbi:MAG: YkgJ family cysteine cluster protein, partial [Chitinivibrionales bacterium]
MENILRRLGNLHKAIDQLVDRLSLMHDSRLRCKRGCYDCCVDDVSVFEIEALNIRHFNEALLKTGIPHPKGLCAFLDNKGACRIYEHRPYVCRTQGLPLHW